jgi:hypothetical protein
MATKHPTSYTKLQATIQRMAESHDAIMEGVAERAAQHVADMEAKREELKRNHAIQSGIARSTS